MTKTRRKPETNQNTAVCGHDHHLESPFLSSEALVRSPRSLLLQPYNSDMLVLPHRIVRVFDDMLHSRRKS